MPFIVLAVFVWLLASVPVSLIAARLLQRASRGLDDTSSEGRSRPQLRLVAPGEVPPAPAHRPAAVRLRVAGAAVAGIVSVTGVAAAAGSLPEPVGKVLAGVSTRVGVRLPLPPSERPSEREEQHEGSSGPPATARAKEVARGTGATSRTSTLLPSGTTSTVTSSPKATRAGSTPTSACDRPGCGRDAAAARDPASKTPITTTTAPANGGSPTSPTSSAPSSSTVPPTSSTTTTTSTTAPGSTSTTTTRPTTTTTTPPASRGAGESPANTETAQPAGSTATTTTRAPKPASTPSRLAKKPTAKAGRTGRANGMR